MHLKSDAKPLFVRVHEISCTLRKAYAQAIEEKLQSGFYEKVEYFEWASSKHR